MGKCITAGENMRNQVNPCCFTSIPSIQSNLQQNGRKKVKSIKQMNLIEMLWDFKGVVHEQMPANFN